MIDLEFLKTLIFRGIITVEFDEDETNVHNIHGEILLKKGEKQPLLIGTLSGYRIHSSEYNFLALERITQDLCEVAEGIEAFIEKFEKSGEMIFGNIYIIDRISIEKKYRNKGVGKYFLAQFIHNNTSLGDMTFLNPQPFELKNVSKNTFKKEALRLAGYYKKLGFEKIKSSSIHYFSSDKFMELGEISELFPRR